MKYSVEELEDSSAFRLMIRIPYDGLLEFVINYLKKRSALTIIFWLVCLLFLVLAVFFRIELAGRYTASEFIFHSVLGLIILPLVSVPFHEAIHIVPYYSFGARDIRIGMDLKQYLFYVTAHRFVLSSKKFITVAIFPFALVSITILVIVLFFDAGLWSWSLSLFLFVHATMCAGDMALLNFLFVNRGKRIYTWDDANTKESFFYEKLAGDRQSSHLSIME